MKTKPKKDLLMNEHIHAILVEMVAGLAQEKGVKLQENWGHTEGFYSWVSVAEGRLQETAKEILECLEEEANFEG